MISQFSSINSIGLIIKAYVYKLEGGYKPYVGSILRCVHKIIGTFLKSNSKVTS